ncbi:uncharacterized [Tachysurus ichikawai]
MLGACVRTSSTLKPDPASTVTVCALPLPLSTLLCEAVFQSKLWLGPLKTAGNGVVTAAAADGECDGCSFRATPEWLHSFSLLFVPPVAL